MDEDPDKNIEELESLLDGLARGGPYSQYRRLFALLRESYLRCPSVDESPVTNVGKDIGLSFMINQLEDGSSLFPTFTSIDMLKQWLPDVKGVLTVPYTAATEFALSNKFSYMVINPGSAGNFLIDQPQLAELNRGEIPANRLRPRCNVEVEATSGIAGINAGDLEEFPLPELWKFCRRFESILGGRIGRHHTGDSISNALVLTCHPWPVREEWEEMQREFDAACAKSDASDQRRPVLLLAETPPFAPLLQGLHVLFSRPRLSEDERMDLQIDRLRRAIRDEEVYRACSELDEAQKNRFNRLYKQGTEVAARLSPWLNSAASEEEAQRFGIKRWRLRRAVGRLVAVLEIDPSSAAARFFLGMARVALGLTAEGYEDLKSASELAPLNSGYSRNAAMTANRLGLNEEAISWTHRAIFAAPEDPGLYSNLALWSFDVSTARDLIEFSRELAEENGHPLHIIDRVRSAISKLEEKAANEGL